MPIGNDGLVKRMRRLVGDMVMLSVILERDGKEICLDSDILVTDLARTRSKVNYAAWVLAGRPEGWDDQTQG